MEASDNMYSRLLQLPTEIRLMIYKEALLAGNITISTRRTDFGNEEEGEERPGIRGLKPDEAPLIRHYYDEALLREAVTDSGDECKTSQPQQPTIQYSESDASPAAQSPANNARLLPRTPPPFLPSADAYLDTRACLLATCRQIHDEVLTYCTSPPLDVYLTYPAGVCVAQQHYRSVLKQARQVRIVGTCDLRYPRRHGRGWGELAALQEANERVGRVQVEALEEVVCMLLGEDAALAHKLWMQLAKPQPTTTTTPSKQNVYVFRDGRMTSLDPKAGHPLAGNPVLQSPSVPTSVSQTAALPPPPPPAAEPPQVEPPQPKAARPTLERLTLRIAYPESEGQDVYSRAWSNKLSAGTAVIPWIYGGAVKVAIARATQGVGIEVDALAEDGTGEGSRRLSCSWSEIARFWRPKDWALRGWSGAQGGVEMVEGASAVSV